MAFDEQTDEPRQTRTRRAGWTALAAIAFACSCGASSASPAASATAAAPRARATEQLEQFADAPSSAVDPSAKRVTAPIFVQGDDGAWRACGSQWYRYEPAAGGAFAVTVREPSEVAQVISAADLQRVRARPERVRVHYAIVGRLLVDTEPSKAPLPAGCGAFGNHLRAVVVGAYTIEMEQGVDLNEPKGSAQPMERAARVIVAGRPQRCLASKGPLPAEGCAVPLALALGHPDGKSRRMLASLIAADARTGQGWGQSGGEGAEGCDRGFALSGSAEQDLQRLVSMCRTSPGMVSVTSVLNGELGEGEDADRHRVRLEAGECYRAFAVGGAGVVDLEMGWVAPGGTLIARELLPRGWSVLPVSGPVCPDVAGDYELHVGVERGEGRYAAQVWKLGR